MSVLVLQYEHAQKLIQLTHPVAAQTLLLYRFIKIRSPNESEMNIQGSYKLRLGILWTKQKLISWKQLRVVVS